MSAVARVPEAAPNAAGCPKRMVYGPCGGVQVDGRCEMAPTPCVFGPVDRTLPVPWADLDLAPNQVRSPHRAADKPAPTLEVPLVLTDLSVPPADVATLTATARILAPTCDAMLVGDHQDRPDFPPSTLARLISEAGGRPWVTLACRDRNRVTLEAELHALRLHGEATVLCVTGDGRAFDVRPDVTQVFDLDGTRLAALAARIGVPVAVAETPTAPPVALRPGRLVQKQHAGAGAGVLNHVGSPVSVATFLAAARALGLTIPVVAAVAVYTDVRSAGVLTALPGLEVDPQAVHAVLSAADPVEAGIAAAVAEARALLAVEGVVGVNLSGLASSRGPAYAASVQAEIGTRIRGEHLPEGAA